MPDAYGFDRLGNEYRCTEEGCSASGHVWDTPEEVRHAHHEMHVREREARLRRENRERLAEYRRVQAQEREAREAVER